MRVIVTGAAGFLGSYLCDALLAAGHRVVGVDNLVTGSLDNLEHLHNEDRFEFHEQDICRPFDLGALDYIFDFASPASPVDYMEHGIETLGVGSKAYSAASNLLTSTGPSSYSPPPRSVTATPGSIHSRRPTGAT